MNEKILKLLCSVGINVSSVTVLGSFVYIDTYKCWEKKLLDVMGQGGFSCISASDGVHLDDYNGFRMASYSTCGPRKRYGYMDIRRV